MPTRWIETDGRWVRAPDSPPLTDAEREEARYRARFTPGDDGIYQSESDFYRGKQLAFLALQAERAANGAGDPADAELPIAPCNLKGAY